MFRGHDTVISSVENMTEQLCNVRVFFMLSMAGENNLSIWAAVTIVNLGLKLNVFLQALLPFV
jgi:hypothetical protein